MMHGHTNLNWKIPSQWAISPVNLAHDAPDAEKILTVSTKTLSGPDRPPKQMFISFTSADNKQSCLCIWYDFSE